MLRSSSGEYIQGVLYNLQLDRAVPFDFEPHTALSVFVLLGPGDRVIVSRVVPELSDPADKGWREYHGIFGRYAAMFLTVPEEPHGLVYDVRLRQ